MKSKSKSIVTHGRKDAGEKAMELSEMDNPIVQAYALRFRQWRREHNKTLKQVATDLGMSIAIISEWENCNRFPSVKAFRSVVEYTGVPAWAFLHPGERGGVTPSGTKGKSKRVNRP